MAAWRFSTDEPVHRLQDEVGDAGARRVVDLDSRAPGSVSRTRFYLTPYRDR